jgi:hypothetical protein
VAMRTVQLLREVVGETCFEGTRGIKDVLWVTGPAIYAVLVDPPRTRDLVSGLELLLGRPVLSRKEP